MQVIGQSLLASIDPRPDGESTIPEPHHLIYRKMTHPSGAHEFLEKHAISGCWKEVAEDKSNTGMVVDEGVPAISVIPVEKEAVLDSTILVDECYVGADVEDGANTPRDELDATVVKSRRSTRLGV